MAVSLNSKRTLALLSVAGAITGASLSAGQGYVEADESLNWEYRSLRLAYGHKAREALRVEQRLWIAQRNNACGLEAKNTCAAELTEKRAKILAQRLEKIESDPRRVRIGECFSTKLTERGSRFHIVKTNEPPMPNQPGITLIFADGHTLVDYQVNYHVARWRINDPIRLCVTDLPKNCPKGDYRGIGYRATNLRTKMSWIAGDSQHVCGGA